MKLKVLTTLILGLMFVVTVSFAQTPRTDKRQKAQRVRIHEGRKSGEVTKGEAAALNKEQRGIRRIERRVNADGVVTPREKMRLERKQNRASRHIHRAKTNPIDNK